LLHLRADTTIIFLALFDLKRIVGCLTVGFDELVKLGVVFHPLLCCIIALKTCKCFE